MTQPVLEVCGVSKRFCRDLRRSLRYGASEVIRALMPWRRPRSGLRRDEFWALENVSFTLRPGEALAVMGQNGAGKSTLLRLVAGLFPPDAGEVRIAGRVQSVIELGSGFNPLLSGRENAELILSWQCAPGDLNGSVEAAAAFAELGEVFDAPLQSYSSGMRARLAYALATQVQSDLLLLDEVLAVGDHAFQRKCLSHIRRYLERGGALLFVSHNVFQIQTVCRRGLLLEHGRVVLDASAIASLDLMFERRGSEDDAVASPIDPTQPQIDRLIATAPDDDDRITTGMPLVITLVYHLPTPVLAACSISLWSRDLSVCIAILADDKARMLPAGPGTRTCLIPALALVAGVYAIRASIFDPDTMYGYAVHGYADCATPLKVEGGIDRLTVLRRNSGQMVMMESVWPD